MFERLFKRPSALRRHCNGPHAKARVRYLAHCADQGYSDSMLGKIAWLLLVVATTLDMRTRYVSAEAIQCAASKPAVFARRARPGSDQSPASTQQMFVRVATSWLQFLGRLSRPPTRTGALARQRSAFEQYMRQERGLSPVTIQSRCAHLDLFISSLPEERSTLRKISIGDIDAFLAAKGTAGWSRASLNVLAANLRSFFRYATGRDWCAGAIAAAIEGPRMFAQERLPRGASWEDVQRLLVGSNGDSAADIRDHAILILLGLYGLRAGEVSRMCLDDINWNREIVNIHRPKQRCAQQYPWIVAAGNAVLRYLREVRHQCGHRELFLTLTAPHRPLSSGSITALVHARLIRVNATGTSRGAHSLRHACAQHLLACGFSFKQIGDHLGHRSANSTFHYAKVDIAGLRQVAEIDMGALL